jgi:hypothetical protein
VAAVAAVELTDSVPLRSVLCLPLAIYGVGFALMRALRPRVGSVVEWHTLAVALSFFVLVAGGFALNAIGALGPRGWVLLTASVTLAGLVVAALRGGEAVEVSGERVHFAPFGALTLAGAVGAALLIVGAVGFAIADAHRWRQFEFTEFWMVPDEARNPRVVSIGIRNAEARSQRFDVEVAADGMPVSGWRSILLQPGESFVRELPVGGRFERLEARLFTSENHDRIYRKVWLDRREGMR